VPVALESSRRRAGVRIACALAMLAAGCGRSTAPAVGDAAEPLRIAAASDLQAALPVVIERFRRAHPEAGAIEPVFGSSGQLAQQIRQGAPFALFLSADRGFVEDLACEAVIRPDSVRTYALGLLSLAVHRDAAEAVVSLDDLRNPTVKHVAIANPDHAPYGRAARQALQRAGLWDELQPKLVLADTVRQALQFVETGNAEAGLVARSLPAPEAVRVTPIDPSRHEPIVQALGVVADAPDAARAEAFAAFVRGDTGQSILATFGFARPDAAGTP
jgi:molybdate transport system substrate-binding protein